LEGVCVVHEPSSLIHPSIPREHQGEDREGISGGTQIHGSNESTRFFLSLFHHALLFLYNRL
jgi:hypothetical protein